MKGQITTTMMISVIKYAIAVIIVLILRAIIPYTVATHIDTVDVEQNLFVNQLLTSPKGLAYEKNGYTHIGIVDPAKFSSLAITYNHRLAAKATLVNLTNTIKAEGFFQEEWYKLWLVLVDKKGAGGTIRKEKSYYVLYPEGENIIPGKLTIDVVMPRG